jgi:small-conductance mechanosensitive channel
VSAAEDSLKRVEELHERLVAAREELEKAAERDDPDAAVDILTQLSELAKEVEAELQKARARADAGG